MVIEVPRYDGVVVLVDIEEGVTGVDRMILVSTSLGLMDHHLHPPWVISIMVLLVMITTTGHLLWCPTPPRIPLCRPEVAEVQSEPDREATDEEVRSLVMYVIYLCYSVCCIGRGGGAKFESGPKPPPGPRNGGGRGRGTRGHSRGGGGPLGMKPQSTPGGQPEYKPEWSATDYSAPGYAAYPAYNQSGSWSEDYTSDTWQQPGGKRPASNVTTPDPKRAHYQPTTPAAQWTGQYQTSTAYPVTPQSSQWSSQTWTGTQQPQGQAVPQGQQPQQQAAWGYQGWTQ